MFLATSGRRDSYEEAARRDLGIVTNLMNQTVAELAENIGHYRKAREKHGLDPDAGRVTVLLHTYLGDDHATARAQALEPMSRYLRSSLQMRSAASALGAGAPGGDPQDVATARDEDLDYLFRRAYDGYCDERALIGTVDTCAPVVDALREAGVDEIAALVDFGMPADLMRTGLEHLDALRERHHPSDADVSAPATDAQRRIWLASQLIGDRAAYNEVQAVRLRGPLDAEALTAAVDGLVERHAGLRTVFRPGGGDETVLQVVRHGRHVPLRVTDVRGQLTDSPAPGPDEFDAAVAAVLREESSRPYDLAEGPLFTPRLLTLADDDHVLVLGLHHIITDAHSAGILAADLEELYTAAVEGRPARFAAPAGSTVGAAEPDRDPADLEWWRRYLDPLPPVPALPTDARAAVGWRAAGPPPRSASTASVRRHCRSGAADRASRSSPRSSPPGSWCCANARARTSSSWARPSGGARRRPPARSVSTSRVLPLRAPCTESTSADRRRTGHPGRAVRGGRPSVRRPRRAARRRQPRPRQPAAADHRVGRPRHRAADRDRGCRGCTPKRSTEATESAPLEMGLMVVRSGYRAAAAYPLRRRSLRRGDGTGLSGRPRPGPRRHGDGRCGAGAGHRRGRRSLWT